MVAPGRGRGGWRGQLDPQERRERLRGYRAVVDHAALHPNAHEHAGQIVELSAAGVPVLLGQMSAATRGLLATRLAAALELTSFEALEIPASGSGPASPRAARPCATTRSKLRGGGSPSRPGRLSLDHARCR